MPTPKKPFAFEKLASREIRKNYSRRGYLYAIENLRTNLVKVGLSAKPENRLKTLKSEHRADGRTWISHCQWDVSTIESRAHRALHAFHSYGEWFAIDFDKAVELCESVLCDEPSEDEILKSKEMQEKQQIAVLECMKKIIMRDDLKKTLPPEPSLEDIKWNDDSRFRLHLSAPLYKSIDDGLINPTESDRIALCEWLIDGGTVLLIEEAGTENSIFRMDGVSGDIFLVNISIIARAVAWASIAGSVMLLKNDDGEEIDGTGYTVDVDGNMIPVN